MERVRRALVRCKPPVTPRNSAIDAGTRLQLVADRSAYAAQTAQIAAFERHVNGLWGVVIVSVLSVVFLVGFMFLPSRY